MLLNIFSALFADLYSSPSQIQSIYDWLNLGCIDEIDTFELENINILDGQNHPLDKKMKTKLSNYLKVKNILNL